MKQLIRILCPLLLLFGCQPKQGYPEGRYFDYSGNDGCSPPNIGHRLGGDLEGIEDHTLKGLKHIESMQASPCFKHWEFDVAPAKDALILRHDWLVGIVPIWHYTFDELPKDTLSLEQISHALKTVKMTKPLMIDLKGIPSNQNLEELKHMALDIKNQHGVDVWFITDQFSALFLHDICEIMNHEVDVMLYFKGGSLCEIVPRSEIEE